MPFMRIYQPEKFGVWIDLISGFRQTPEYVTGIERLWSRVRGFSNEKVRVNFTEWNANRRAQVEFMLRHCADDCQFIQVDYSWGLGYGGKWLAEELGDRDRKVNHVIGIDGVYHSDAMPWRAITGPITNRLVGKPVIWMPDNVERVTYWRQNIDKWYNPKGHEIRVVGDTDGKKVEFVRYLHRSHSAMDEAPEIHDFAVEVITQAVASLAA